MNDPVLQEVVTKLEQRVYRLRSNLQVLEKALETTRGFLREGDGPHDSDQQTVVSKPQAPTPPADDLRGVVPIPAAPQASRKATEPSKPPTHPHHKKNDFAGKTKTEAVRMVLQAHAPKALRARDICNYMVRGGFGNGKLSPESLMGTVAPLLLQQTKVKRIRRVAKGLYAAVPV